MKSLIVEDDFTSRKLLSLILSPYGECDIAVDGKEGYEAFKKALDENKPYHLICMDIMMPNVSGNEAVKYIREIERDGNITATDEVRIIMTTALNDPKPVFESLNSGATEYLVKPIDKKLLLEKLQTFGLI